MGIVSVRQVDEILIDLSALLEHCRQTDSQLPWSEQQSAACVGCVGRLSYKIFFYFFFYGYLRVMTPYDRHCT